MSSQVLDYSLNQKPWERVVRSLATSFRQIRRNRIGFIGFIVFTTMIVVSLLGPFLVTSPVQGSLDEMFQAPSTRHWLGTDGQGRDVLKQLIIGGRDVVLVGAISSVLSMTIAVFFGSLAAFKGGVLDTVTVQITDLFLTLPQFPILIVLSAYMRLDNTLYLASLLGLLGWPTLLRAVRAEVLSLKQREYVEAARLVGLNTPQIIRGEVIPNMASYLMINFILGVTGAVYALAGLYLLGLAPMSGTNWGIMINNAWASGAMFYAPAMSSLVSPLMAIALFQLSAIWFVRSLEELLDPRLRTQ